MSAQPAPAAPIGVLVVNLGTPDSPAVKDVRRYLREFLSDPRVVDLPRVLWRPILEFAVLPSRSPKSARAYASVWTSAGSPLMAISRQQGALLAEQLGGGFHVELAMRYGRPSIEGGVEALIARGCARIVLLTMFPQYSNASVGSVYAEVFRVLSSKRAPPALETVAPWFDDAGYIAALAERCAQSVPVDRPVSHWVFSFHGYPERYVKLGDPYRDHCERTAEALAARLGLTRDAWSLAYQSRFGREAWLQPYTDIHVPALARRFPRLGIVMPGFVADCLETLEEIAIRLRADFERAGGRELVVVPCLNDSPSLAAALAARVRAMSA